MEEKKLDAAKLVSSAILGLDYRNIIVNDKAYIIHPPTIAKLAGATYWLSDIGEGETIHDVIQNMSEMTNIARALSWFIQGDDTLADELAQGTMKEIVGGLEAAFSLIDAENFIRLSVLARSAKTLVAKQR